MRRLLAALLACALACAPARGGEGADAGPPVDLAAWDARDAEARWVLLRNSLDAGGREEAWVRFLDERREWDLLEAVVLTSRSGFALEALARADAPGWLRCAVWSLTANESHKREGAAARLTQDRPGVSLAWFERHPTAGAGAGKAVLAKLREQNPPKGDASRYSAPFDPERVFADLRPPDHVEELGDATRVRLGVRYVHQVERALRALEESGLSGEPWAGRVVALLVHPSSRVRRAAALAYGWTRLGPVPVARLVERVDDPAEAPEVRSAALVGLSYSDHPAAYARLLEVGGDPRHAAWRGAVSRLGDVDDGFAASLWAGLDRATLPPDGATFLDEQSSRLRERVQATDEPAFANRVATMLERAAWLDLRASPLGTRLVEWTTGAIRARLAEPRVRAAVVAARDGYEPPTSIGASDPARVSLRVPLRERVRDLARSILESASARNAR